MKKILLVKPEYPGSPFGRGAWPVSLGYIAQALHDAGIDYQAVDMDFSSPEQLHERIRTYRPDALGISMMSCCYKHHYALLNGLKEEFPAMQIVAGGPHVSFMRESVLSECPAIDYGIVLEGEQAIVELMQDRDPPQIQGLLWRRPNEVSYTGDRPLVKDLDELSFPTYQGFDSSQNYRSIIPLVSSRGCPYKCIFCGAHLAIGSKWRGRTPDNVLGEIEYWYQRGYRKFTFADSNFSLDRKRLHELCRKIAENGFKGLSFTAEGVRADHLDRESLSFLKDAGFKELAFGVESGSNRILKNLRKGETVEQIDRTLAIAAQMGFKLILFFVLGSPGETQEDIEKSFHLAQKYPVSRVHFFNLSPIPRTELYRWAKENKFLLKSWRDYLGGNFGFSDDPLFFTDKLSVRQIRKYLRKATTVAKKIKLRNESKQIGRSGPLSRLMQSVYMTAYRLFLRFPRLRHRWHRFRRQTIV